MSFERALAHVLQYEGGFVDHPEDPGGATNLGITAATLAAWRRGPVTTDDVRRLERAEAAAIYRARYWNATSCDDWPHAVALMVFDCAVNQGVRRATRWLQAAAGVGVDGVIGPATRTAVLAASPRALVEAMYAARLAHYRSLKTWATFGRGWTRRLDATLAAALAMLGAGAP